MNQSLHLSSRAEPVTEFLHDLVAIQAETSPDAVAVVYRDIRTSYSDLDSRANQIAHALAAYGVGPETQVGVCLERSPDLLLAWLGILKAGAAYVPLDPNYPTERLSFMLSDARVRVVLTQQALAARITVPAATPVLLIDGEFGRHAAQTRSTPVRISLQPDHLAYVIYTSGSTGQPKGVGVSHRALAQLIRWHIHAFQITEQDRATMVAGLGFDAAVWELWPYLSVGASVYLVDEQIRPSATLLRDWLLSERITIAFLPTPIAERALRLTWPNDTALRVLLTGGDQLHCYAPADLPFTLVNNYGPTEGTVVSTSGVVATLHHELPPTPSIGRPISHVQAYVLDEAMHPVAQGEPGELYIGGNGLARGYLFRPDLTAELFVPNPFSDSPGERLYRSGDRVCWQSDGTLAFLGRQDDQIKLRGFRIELGEIEAVLRQHPGVVDAVVVVREGGGEKRLIGYVTPAITAEQARELRAYLEAHVPDYMVPAAFVGLDALPLTPHGKVDRRSLPLPPVLDDDRPHEAPLTAAEQALAAIWCDVLGRAFIGRHDNFFELGGDSIVNIQIVARARQHGIYLSSRHIFDYPTIAELAAQAIAVEAIQGEQGLVSGDVPLTPIQHWFFAQALPAPHHFNQTFVLEANEGLDVAVLEQALDALVQHHDALRLRYRQTDQGWQQWHCQDPQRNRVMIVDLAALPAEQREATFEALVAEQQASLDLETEPLIRGTVFRRGAQPDWLLLVIHHLVVDGVSWRVLLEDLESAYQQLLQQRSVQLPAKTTSFQAWAKRLVEYARTSDELHQQVSYWNTAAHRQIAPLPVDSAGEASHGAHVQTVWSSLSAQETTTLLHDLPSAYRTQINDVLLTALVLTFANWTGKRSLLINLEGHGREALFSDLDISRTVGWFTSIFPVLLDIEHATEIGAALVAIKEQLRRLPQRGIGYGILRFLSDAAADLAPQPQPQLSFNYLGQFDPSFGGAASRFRLIRESQISDRSPLNPRPHLLEVDGYIDEGRLRFVWTYSDNVYRSTTVTRLAESFMDQLRTLIQHCQAPTVGSLTPSDVPLARLDQQQLDRLLQRLHEQRAAVPRRTIIADIEDIYTLSPLQEGMLVHKLRVSDDEIYMVQYSCVLSGNGDPIALRRAWQFIAEQHPILRSAFFWEGLERPVQIVHRSIQVPWHEEDWRALDADMQQQRLDQFLQHDRVRGFTLQAPPLMRMALFRLSDATYRFVWSFHHLLLDGWSTPLLIKDVFESAERLTRGTALAFERARGYRDYIAWHQAQPTAEAERFWRAELRGLSEPTVLGIDRPLTPGRSTQGVLAEIRRRLPESTTTALYGMARQHKLTVNTLIQGIWAVLLSRYSGTSDIVFGATVATRPAVLPDVERMIGPLINTLPVRIQVQRQARLIPWLTEIQARQSEARRYDHVSLVDIQQWSAIPAATPLFESLVVFEHYPASGSLRQSDSSTMMVHEPLIFERTSYPLTIVVGAGAELMLKLIYDPARFDAASVERIAEHLERLLQGLAQAPDMQVGELPWTSRADLDRIAAWNASTHRYQQASTLPELIASQAARTLDAIAVVYEATALTYRELERRANQLAHCLRDHGVGRESLVGICLERSPELVISMLGILKAGGAYVPLDPEYPVDRLRFMMEDAQIAALITVDALTGRIPAAANVPLLVLDGALGSALDHAPAEAPQISIDPQQLAYVIYTSGSTGRPKGAMNAHAGVVNRLLWGQARYPIDASDRVLQKTPVSFDVSVWEFFWPLIAGAQLVLARPGGHKDPAYLCDTIVRAGITVLHFVPPMLSIFLDQPGIERCTSLRRVFCSGEALPWDLQQRCFERLPVTLHNLYGPTEASIEVTFWDCRQHSDHALVPIGHPIANMQTYILDDQFQPLPIGVAGELYLGGVGVARGYHRRPALTAETFVPDPFAGTAGARLYRTGDRARYLADGAIEFLGRLDHQVKLRGFRIELDEISMRLRQHPAVQDAVTLMHLGAGGSSQLVAYVVEYNATTQGLSAPGSHDATGLASDLRDFLKLHLPEFMVPAAILLLDHLPLLPNGKLDRRALPTPTPPGSAGTSYVAPRTESERRLLTIWTDVLTIERIGVEDNFFDLGGHSLLAMQLLARIHADLKAELPFRAIFDHPSIAALAALIDQTSTTAPGNSTVPMSRVSREAHRAKRSSVLKDEAGNVR